MYKTINGRYGPVTFLTSDQYVGRSLFYYGEYNPDECEKIVSLAQPGKLCLDIGANFGCISQALEAANHSVIAWEPQPEIATLAAQNITGTVHACALGSVCGSASMPRVHYSAKNNFGGLSIGSSSLLGTIRVPVTTLDSYNLTNVGLIKIDVEGFELEVLKGGLNTIKSQRPVLYIEDDRPQNSRALREFILGLGYQIIEHKPPLFRQNNYFNHQKNVWDKNYASHNIICLP